MLLLLHAALSPALALDPPCYGFLYSEDERIEGEHYWVEWDPELATLEDAQARLDAAEAAHEVYVDMGWEVVDDPVAVRIVPSEFGFSFGRTETIDCDGSPSPVIHLFTEDERIPGTSTTKHEVAHAVQYAYMGSYLDSVNSWIWWMEGCATWLTAHAEGDMGDLAWDASNYTSHPHLALHHGLAAFLIPEQSNHMYGTALLALFIDEQYGGSDTVRATWEYAAPFSGEDIYFPDAIEASGLDFEEVWPHFMARFATVDVSVGAQIDAPTKAAEVLEYPAEGEVDDEALPQGLGISIVSFAPNKKRKTALEVRFEGNPEIEWFAVLATAESTDAGSPILRYTPLDVVDGVAEGWIADFRHVEGFLIVSPISETTAGHEYAWSAALVEDPGEMPGTIVLSEPVAASCGCDSGSPGPLPLLCLVLPWSFRRRESST